MNQSNDIQFRVRIEGLEKRAKGQADEIQRLYETTAAAHMKCRELENRIDGHLRWHNTEIAKADAGKWWQFWK